MDQAGQDFKQAQTMLINMQPEESRDKDLENTKEPQTNRDSTMADEDKGGYDEPNDVLIRDGQTNNHHSLFFDKPRP